MRRRAAGSDICATMSERMLQWRIGNHAADRRKSRLEKMNMPRQCNPGLDDRCRDPDGEIRRKNGNTRVDTLRDTYGPGFAAGLSGDAKLSTILQRTGARSLSGLLKKR
jgi:hypothetical protein